MDAYYMQKVLENAKKYIGKTSPNPSVAALIVKNNKIIAAGAHKGFGKPHAERIAIKKAGKKAKGATLYCNLEPCNHLGQNPPCTDIIIKAGIKKVVFASKDPNPLVKKNNSVKILKKHGIQVVHGILDKENKKLNEFYFHFMKTKKPFVALKMATTKEGYIADEKGNSFWITNKTSRQNVHHLRSIYDAVLVGSNTIKKDNPYLNIRDTGKFPKQRKTNTIIVLDTNLEISPKSNIFKSKNSKVIIFASKKTELQNSRTFTRRSSKSIVGPELQVLRSRATQIIQSPLKRGKINLKYILIKCASLNISSILIEGGAQIYESFLKEKLVQKIFYFQNPKKSFSKGITALKRKKIPGKQMYKKEFRHKNQSDILAVYYL
ncbi:bifunctional diaminohydroxyphosphoribosylaminopyrimidine deaminase/5-amino-6-(5-phosphoribosylamino)uracil reductase RibD [Candidatus Margulisiibacteriota bacterium]